MKNPTITELAISRGKEISSVRVQIRRVFGSCTFDNNEILPWPEDQIYKPRGKKGKIGIHSKTLNGSLPKVDTKEDDQPSNKEDLKENLPEKETVDWKRYIPTPFDFINYIEMILVCIGLWRMYEIPGAVLAAMMCLYLWNAQRLAKNADLRDANESALKMVGLLAVVTFFLHYITFWTATSGFDLQIEDQALDFWAHIGISFAPAFMVSYLSFDAVKTTSIAALDKKRVIRLKKLNETKKS